MSFYAIRYEYADESNSRQSATAADPPLFKQEEEEDEQQYDQSNFMDNAIINDPGIQQQQFQSAISCEEEMNNPTVISNARQNREQQMFSSTFNHHQQQQHSYWQPKQEEDDEEDEENNRRGRCWPPQQQPSMIRRTHSLQTNCAYQREVENQQQYYQSDLLMSNFLGDDEDQENIAPSPGQFARKKRLQSSTSSSEIQANHRRSIKEEVEFYGTTGNEEWPPVNEEERRGQNNVVIVRRGSNEQIIDESGGGGDFIDEFMESINDSSKSDNSKEQQQIAPNGFGKPAYSYSCLIGLSLKNSPSGELTVSEIYTFLCYHFPYFREAPSGWKNSVRHNLSLNKCFKKIEIETPGSHGRKSCLWTMNPARMAKMDQELKKWRERDEMRILNAMENPDDLDALQSGTMGMPPNMKPRRFSVLKMDDDNSPTLAAIRSPQRSFSASFPSSTTIQRNHPHPYNIENRQIPLQCHQQNSIQPAFSTSIRQQSQPQHSRKIATHSQGRHNESMHSQAKRKLEHLLKQRQKTSSIVNNATDVGLAPPPKAKLSRLELAEQEAAAAFLYHQLYNNKKILDEGKQGKSQIQIRQTSQQQSSSSSLQQLSHDEQLAIRIDDHRTSPNAHSLIGGGGFQRSSPFASTSLGLESCENALTRNPLLDPTL